MVNATHTHYQAHVSFASSRPEHAAQDLSEPDTDSEAEASSEDDFEILHGLHPAQRLAARRAEPISLVDSVLFGAATGAATCMAFLSQAAPAPPDATGPEQVTRLAQRAAVLLTGTVVGAAIGAWTHAGLHGDTAQERMAYLSERFGRALGL